MAIFIKSGTDDVYVDYYFQGRRIRERIGRSSPAC